MGVSVSQEYWLKNREHELSSAVAETFGVGVNNLIKDG